MSEATPPPSALQRASHELPALYSSLAPLLSPAHQVERRAGHAFAQAALNAMDSPLCVVDADGTIVMVNQAWRDFGRDNTSGADGPDFVGTNYLAVCDGAMGPNAAESAPMAVGLRSVMAGERHEFRLEYPCDSPTERRWYVAVVRPFQGERGFMVVTHQDITALKQAQQAQLDTNTELLRSNAHLEQFAYAASHDLVEPLRSVASSVQLLQMRYAGQLDARADTFIAHAVSGAARMQVLITDLLTFARINGDSQQRRAVSMEAALTNAIANLETAIVDSNAQITHDPLPQVRAQSGQMTQLLQNLLANAIKFRGDKPAIAHVGARQAEHEWVFSVADRGIGIEPPYFNRIFELFKRLHTREEYAGTGIGLSLCKKIVEHHGGRIWVESEAGQGATFYFTLPLHARKKREHD